MELSPVPVLELAVVVSLDAVLGGAVLLMDDEGVLLDAVVDGLVLGLIVALVDDEELDGVLDEEYRSVVLLAVSGELGRLQPVTAMPAPIRSAISKALVLCVCIFEPPFPLRDET